MIRIARRIAGAAPQTLLFAVYGALLGMGEWISAAALAGAVIGAGMLLAGVWWVAMGWIIGSPTVFVFVNDLTKGIPFVRAERVFFVVVMAMLASGAIFRKDRPLQLIPAERAIVAFLSFAMLSLLIGARGKSFADLSRDDLSFYFDGYAMPMLSFMIARRLPWTEDRAMLFFRLLAIVGLFLAFTAVLQLFLGVSAFVPKYLAVIHSEDRAVGTFGNAPEYGMVVGTLLLVTVMLLMRTRSDTMRAVYACLVIAMAGGVILSKTRADWLGLAVGCAFVYGYDSRSRPALSLMALVGAVAMIVAIPFLLQMQGFMARIYDTAPIFNRMAAWATAVNVMMGNPVFGIGLSRYGFGREKNDYLVGFGDVGAQWAAGLNVPHNEFLFVGAMTGFVGLFLFIRVLRRTARELLDATRLPEESLARQCAIYVMASGVLLITNALLVDLVNSRYVTTLFFFLCGVVSALAMDGLGSSARSVQPGRADVAPAAMPPASTARRHQA